MDSRDGRRLLYKSGKARHFDGVRQVTNVRARKLRKRGESVYYQPATGWYLWQPKHVQHSGGA